MPQRPKGQCMSDCERGTGVKKIDARGQSGPDDRWILCFNDPACSLFAPLFRPFVCTI